MASISPTSLYSEACQIKSHPFQSYKLEKLCASCQGVRDALLNQIDSDQTVRFDEWRWKVAYSSPNADQTDWEKWGEQVGGRKKKTASGRWSWRRSKRKSKMQSGVPVDLVDDKHLPLPLPSTPLTPRAQTYQLAIASAHLSNTALPLHSPQRVSASKAMPTPESALFLAKKPTVPPTFDGVDYDDNRALKAAQDAIIREQWVKSMMARLVREEMGKCYYREGVNHLEKCGHLRERYFELLKDAKIKGYLFEQQNYIPKS
ncbi:hypothetical protein B0A49_08730 [Cryomyces minteri]|uniref:NADH-ubiquinone oxidoreductase 12 kDa subunit, mitochondrial n=1 Tax=Cryomyces minteri TaxID=331657 RepID=A0A4U0X2D3_9PEZI|nr:hypothetical protein B0A49_08730 [Cryomyces minteri]